MLTRLVRVQLAIFTMVSIVGIASMAVVYLQLPTMLGIGRITVTLELPDTGGLYRFANVTYRGVQVGKVTDVDLSDEGATATLSLRMSPRIPAHSAVEIRSMSAIGEQYVDFKPDNLSGPYLHSGSVIAKQNISMPLPVGPMLDKASALIGSIPKQQLAALIDQSAAGLNGAGFDIGSLVDSSAEVSHGFAAVADQTGTLINDSVPLLDAQVQSVGDIRSWAHHLAGVSDQLVADDTQVRTILRATPQALQEVSRLLDEVKPTLPVLLANLTSLGKVGVTYLPSLEQLLVLVPPFLTGLQATSQAKNATGYPLGNFRMQLGDAPACTVGFLPPSSWRSPEDTTTIDTPDGLYCKLPQDAPTVARGVRNMPCMGHPGKRAPTVQICDSDKPFMPLALREHTYGPRPLDPNLLAQGIAPDARVDPPAHLFAPIEGTLPPPGTTHGPPPPSPPVTALPPPDIAPPDMPDHPAAPSAAHSSEPGPGPSVAVAKYDPSTGSYLGPNGMRYAQSDLSTGPARQWQDMILWPTRI